MRRLAPYLLAAVSLTTTDAAQADSVRSRGGASIEQQVGVDLQGAMAVQSLRASNNFDLSRSATSPSSGLAAASVKPASLTLSGGAGDAVSLDYPRALDLAREGGIETLQLRMSQGDGFAGPGVTILSLDGGLSFRVGGGVEAPVNPIVPGNYRGLLVIVAQWN